MAEHELKILPEYFEAVVSGCKTFEVRKDDRGFQAGDYLLLREYEGGDYTGRGIRVLVTYVLRSSEYCKEGYCIMGVKYKGSVYPKMVAKKYNYTENCSIEEKVRIFNEMLKKQELKKEPETIKIQPVKRGKWLAENSRPKSVMFVCSVCGKIAHDRPLDSAKVRVRKRCNLEYCPHCGARMDGGTENEHNVQ